MLAIDWSHTKGLTVYDGSSEESINAVKSIIMLNSLEPLNRATTFIAKEIYGLKEAL